VGRLLSLRRGGPHGSSSTTVTAHERIRLTVSTQPERALHRPKKSTLPRWATSESDATYPPSMYRKGFSRKRGEKMSSPAGTRFTSAALLKFVASCTNFSAFRQRRLFSLKLIQLPVMSGFMCFTASLSLRITYRTDRSRRTGCDLQENENRTVRFLHAIRKQTKHEGHTQRVETRSYLVARTLPAWVSRSAGRSRRDASLPNTEQKCILHDGRHAPLNGWAVMLF